MPALEDTSDFVRRIIKTCRDSRVKIGVAMLDRKLYSTNVIRALRKMDVDCLIPCVNTAAVVRRAITEFSCGERKRVSVFRIVKSKNDYEEFTMIITKRKKSKKSDGKKPEEEYIAFATSMPEIDPDRYSAR